MSLGAIDCALSHLSILEQSYQAGHENDLDLER
jgi:hypothetical protein